MSELLWSLDSANARMRELEKERDELKRENARLKSERDEANLFRERNRVALNRRDDALGVATKELERLRFNVERVDKIGIDKCLRTINELLQKGAVKS